MKRYNIEKLMSHNPTKYGEQLNQLGQLQEFYEHPLKGDEAPVICIIDGIAFDTDFFDTDDFFDGSDYNYCLVQCEGITQIKCHFEI